MLPIKQIQVDSKNSYNCTDYINSLLNYSFKIGEEYINFSSNNPYSSMLLFSATATIPPIGIPLAYYIYNNIENPDEILIKSMGQIVDYNYNSFLDFFN